MTPISYISTVYYPIYIILGSFRPLAPCESNSLSAARFRALVVELYAREGGRTYQVAVV
jgi:hypothetical protein